MPRPSRRDEIIDVAASLFAARGFSSVSTRDVAGLVGMKSSALYHHFKDKMDLTIAVIERVNEERSTVYGKIVGLDVSPEEKIKAIVYHQIKSFSENPNAIRLFQYCILDGNESLIDAVLHDIYRDVSEDICRCIRLVDPEVDAYFVHFTIIVMSLGYVSFRPLIERFHPLKKRDRDPKQLMNVVLKAALPDVDWQAVRLLVLPADAGEPMTSKPSSKGEAKRPTPRRAVQTKSA